MFKYMLSSKKLAIFPVYYFTKPTSRCVYIKSVRVKIKNIIAANSTGMSGLIFFLVFLSLHIDGTSIRDKKIITAVISFAANLSYFRII